MAKETREEKANRKAIEKTMAKSLQDEIDSLADQPEIGRVVRETRFKVGKGRTKKAHKPSKGKGKSKK